MAGMQMLGVVLWSDADDAKAVIWCEDHGQLAYYTPRASSVHDGGLADPLDAGDLIQFEISVEDQLRFVHNPQVLSEMAFPGLADRLFDTVTESGDGRGRKPANNQPVIDLSAVRSQRQLATA